MHVCPRIDSVSEFSLEAQSTQYNPTTGEFLADPTGHIRLYLVNGPSGWSALTQKHELPAEAFEEFDRFGLALQLATGTPNGYMTPYKNIVLVPSGMRARIDGDRVTFTKDELRQYMVDNWRIYDDWEDDILSWPGADETNTTMLLSGGMDSVSILLSQYFVGRPLPAMHIARPGWEHELPLAQEVSDKYAVRLELAPFTPVTPDDAYAHLEFSPFGRMFNFAMYNRVFKNSLKTPYALHGELSLIDMTFYDHSQRFRHLRRRFFHDPVIRKLFLGARPMAHFFPKKTGSSKLATLLRSLRTSRNKRLMLMGTVLGPKGFPGLTDSALVTDDESYLTELDRRFEPFVDGSDDYEHFMIDFWLFAYRFVEGYPNKTGPQEASASAGKETHHPMNRLKALLRGAAVAPKLARDKTILKKHFIEKCPELGRVIWFKKDLSLGGAEPYWVDSPEWQRLLDDALDAFPATDLVSKDAFAADLHGRPWSEHHMSYTSLIRRRQLALDSLRTPRPTKTPRSPVPA